MHIYVHCFITLNCSVNEMANSEGLAGATGAPKSNVSLGPIKAWSKPYSCAACQEYIKGMLNKYQAQ